MLASTDGSLYSLTVSEDGPNEHPLYDDGGYRPSAGARPHPQRRPIRSERRLSLGRRRCCFAAKRTHFSEALVAA